MKVFASSAQNAAAVIWLALRQIFGDAAYENYLRSLTRSANQSGVPTAPLTPAEFYVDSLRRRYSTISRCC